MYSFFAMSGSPAARLAVAAIGSLIITAVLIIGTPAAPAATHLTIGVLA